MLKIGRFLHKLDHFESPLLTIVGSISLAIYNFISFLVDIEIEKKIHTEKNYYS